jgi:CCDC81-like prokaryotic HU domain 2/CCDC81-like prokaryotic HU domain 1
MEIISYVCGMNIENYISQLLYRYQCVTVPGFGAFLTEIQSAYLIENTQSFYPPKKLISFNALLKNNDGLLANHIAKSEKSSYESALNYINFEVEIWYAKLQEFGQFSIKNVGEFYLTSENKIVFEPVHQINYLTESFGLSKLKSPTVSRIAETIADKEITQTVIPIQEKAEVVVVANVEKAAEKVADIPVIEIKKAQQRNPYLKYAAILLVAAGVEAKYIIQLNNETVTEKNLLVQKRVQQKVYDKIQSATFVITNPLEHVITAKELKKNYHLIAYTSHQKEDALMKSEKLQLKGYKSTVLPMDENGNFQVTYESYTTFDEAKKNELSVKPLNENAWVLTKELK